MLNLSQIYCTKFIVPTKPFSHFENWAWVSESWWTWITNRHLFFHFIPFSLFLCLSPWWLKLSSDSSPCHIYWQQSFKKVSDIQQWRSWCPFLSSVRFISLGGKQWKEKCCLGLHYSVAEVCHTLYKHTQSAVLKTEFEEQSSFFRVALELRG